MVVSAKPKPIGRLDAAAVYQVIRDLRKEVGKLRDDNEALLRGVRCVTKQNRDLLERFDAMEVTHTSDRSTWSNQHAELVTRLDCVIAANNGLSHENDALLKALGLKALKAMSVPQQIDKATVMHLVAAIQAKVNGRPYEDADLSRYYAEAEPMHRNSGN